jgi:hypothetical protein
VPALLRLGVEIGRIVLKSAGPGWSPGSVVAQEPAPGADLADVRRVVLHVCGPRAVDSLPYPMRDSADGEFRSDRLFGLFDDQFLKLGVHIRAAGGLLNLTPDDPVGAYRWITDTFASPGNRAPVDGPRKNAGDRRRTRPGGAVAAHLCLAPFVRLSIFS